MKKKDIRIVGGVPLLRKGDKLRIDVFPKPKTIGVKKDAFKPVDIWDKPKIKKWTKEGNPIVPYRGKYYELPPKMQAGIYEGFTPLKDWQKYERSPADKSRSAKMKKHWDIVHGKKLVGPVDLHLTRQDAKNLTIMMGDVNLAIYGEDIGYMQTRDRILNKLKREGVK